MIIVVPTIREESIKRFLKAWESEFANHQIIVVEDNPKKTFKINQPNLTHYAWDDIDNDLGKDSWIIPRRTDCIRSYGIYKAYQMGVDNTLTLDDDCYPLDKDFVDTHLAHLNTPTSRWVWTTRRIKSRGVPFRNLGMRETVINMGFWRGAADLDAPTQLVLGPRDLEPQLLRPVSPDTYFPMCGMNLSFKTYAAPMMYWLLMGRDYEYDRFGDIWCGLFAKKICDHLGLGITAGVPAVKHERASNVWVNLKKEQAGLEVNETLWETIDNIKLTEMTILTCYREVARKLPLEGEYWDKVKEAMRIWINLF